MQLSKVSRFCRLHLSNLQAIAQSATQIESFYRVNGNIFPELSSEVFEVFIPFAQPKVSIFPPYNRIVF